MRDYESVSSIQTFMKCPKAYEIRYVLDLEPTTTEAMEIGSFIHRQIEVDNMNDAEYIPFVNAVNNYLSDNGLLVAAKEQSFIVELGQNRRIKLIVDLLTNDGQVVDYKATQSPDYYKYVIGFQMRVYNWLLNMPCDYLLLEYKLEYPDGKDGKKVIQFKKAHPFKNVFSEIMIERTKEEVNQTLDMIEKCWETQIFPPSYSECHRCLFKKHCDYYNRPY